MPKNASIFLITLIFALTGCASSGEQMNDPDQVVGDATAPDDNYRTRIEPAEMSSMPTWLIGCWTRSDKEKLYAECWKRQGDELTGTIHRMDRETSEVEIVETRVVQLAGDKIELTRTPQGADSSLVFTGVNEDGERIRLKAPPGVTNTSAAAMTYEVDQEGRLRTSETKDTDDPPVSMAYEPVSALTPVEALELIGDMERTDGISVYSAAEAPIFIDGRATGKKTPATLDVPAGEYDVSIVCPDSAERLPQKKIAVDGSSRVGMRFRCRGTPRQLNPETP